MRVIVTNVLIALFGLVVTLTVVESGFRLVHATAHHRMHSDRPNFYYAREHSVGARDRWYPLEKAPGSFRIAVIGDSFSFGPDVQIIDTFPKRLEAIFNLNDGAPLVEVLNFGTPGLSTVQELALIREALSYHPDTLLLQITLNDAQAHRLQDESEDVKTNFRSPTDSPDFPSWLKSWHSLMYVLNRVHNQHSVRAYIDYHSNLFDNPRTWGIFEKSITNITHQCQKSGVKLAAVLFPLFDFPIDRNYPFKDIHSKITALFEASAVPFLDLQKAYRGMSPERLHTKPGKDSHPNEIAHRIAADAIAVWLYKERLIPAQTFPKLLFRKRDNSKEKLMEASPGTLNHLD